MLIRAATHADSAAVETVLNASYPALMGEAYDAELLARTLPRMTRANPALLASGTYYLAIGEDGAAAGCGGWSAVAPGSDVREPGIAHIRHFGTHPDWTGRGVGRALYQRCEEEAGAAGFLHFTCYSSLNGEGFYRSLGFATLGPIEVRMGPDILFPSILMTREIPSA